MRAKVQQILNVFVYLKYLKVLIIIVYFASTIELTVTLHDVSCIESK